MWRRVANELEQGLVVLDRELRVIASNVAASLVLAPFGDRVIDVEALRLLSASVAQGPRSGSFSPVVIVTAADGRRVFARAKRIDPDGVLLTLSRETLRERDLVDVLRDRYRLSLRERQIVLLLRGGLTNRDIAEKLQLSEATVKTYLSRVFEAFQVTSRTALLAAVERIRSET